MMKKVILVSLVFLVASCSTKVPKGEPIKVLIGKFDPLMSCKQLKKIDLDHKCQLFTVGSACRENYYKELREDALGDNATYVQILAEEEVKAAVKEFKIKAASFDCTFDYLRTKFQEQDAEIIDSEHWSQVLSY